MSLRVHIDELVLHGFAPGDRTRIADALQSRLTRLLAERGVPAALTNGGTVDRLDAGTFQAEPPARPDTTGARIAQAVYGGLAAWASE